MMTPPPGTRPLLALAPMQDVTDLAFMRTLARIGSLPDVFLTPYFRSTRTTCAMGEENLRCIRENETGVPIVAQLAGSEAEPLVRDAQALLHLPIAGINLNAGCPSPLVNRHGAGAGLLRDLPRFRSVLQAMREAVPAGLFSVKTRLGWESADEFPAVLACLQDAAPDAVMVHARTRRELYGGTLHWDMVRLAVESLSCPVWANGDITTPGAAAQCMDSVRPAGLMIGRGAVRNPYIFRQLKGGEPPSAEEMQLYYTVLAEETRRILHTKRTETGHCNRMKKYLAFCYADFPPQTEYLLRRCTDMDSMLRLLSQKMADAPVFSCIPPLLAVEWWQVNSSFSMSKYFVLVNKQQTGPFEEAEVAAAFQQGTYAKGTLVWCKGMSQWSPIETVPALAGQPEPAPQPELPPQPEPAPVIVPEPAPAPQASAAAEPAPEQVALPAQEPAPEAAPEAAAEPAPAGPPAPQPQWIQFFVNLWEKVSAFALRLCTKDFWKSLSIKTMIIAGAALTGFLLTIVLLICLWPSSINSDKDVARYVDKNLERVKACDREIWQKMKSERRSMLHALNTRQSTLSERKRLAGLIAAFGDKSGIVYLFEKKDFEPEVADAILQDAAAGGRYDIVEYLLNNQCSNKIVPRNVAFKMACEYGHVKVCRLLVEQGGVEVQDQHLYRLVAMDRSEYKEGIRLMNAICGLNRSEEDLMEGVAEVAAYLIKAGANPHDPSVLEAAKTCPNPKLRALILGKK